MKYSFMTFATLSAVMIKQEMQLRVSNVVLELDEVGKLICRQWDKSRDEFLNNLILIPVPSMNTKGVKYVEKI